LKRFVPDASIVLSWGLENIADPLARRIFELWRYGEAVVPSIWALEVANGFLTAERRERITSDRVAFFLSALGSLRIQSVDLKPGDVFSDVIVCAREYQLTSYDMAYLHLAKSAGVPLATLDQALAAAARKAGVKLLV
jgi:predicted nucleic acid-binding protein